MDVTIIDKNGQAVALVNSDEILIWDIQSTLDFMVNITYQIKDFFFKESKVMPFFFISSEDEAVD